VVAPLSLIGPHAPHRNISDSVHWQKQTSKVTDLGTAYFEEEQEEEEKTLARRLPPVLIGTALFFLHLPASLLRSIDEHPSVAHRPTHYSFSKAPYLVLSVFRL